MFGTICEESALVNRNVTQKWISEVWPVISDGYLEKNILNADETGLFYKMTPDKTHKLKGESCSGRML